MAAALKIMGIVALAVCLIERLYSGNRPRPGANLVARTQHGLHDRRNRRDELFAPLALDDESLLESTMMSRQSLECV